MILILKKKKNSANDFDKDFFKLMINSVYGKTMENLRKRINVRLVNNENDFLKYTSRPTYVTHKLFHKGFAAIHEIKSVLMLSKPIYVGFTVSELRKWMIYGFRYNFIQKNFNAELLFTDRDSLISEKKSENVYEEFFKWKDWTVCSCHVMYAVQSESTFYSCLNVKELLAGRRHEI